MTLVIHITLYRHVQGGYNYNYSALQSSTLSSGASAAIQETTSDTIVLPTNSPPSLPRPTMSGRRKRRLGQDDEEDESEKEAAARGPVPPSGKPSLRQYQLQKDEDRRAGARKGAARGSESQGKGRGRSTAPQGPKGSAGKGRGRLLKGADGVLYYERQKGSVGKGKAKHDPEDSSSSGYTVLPAPSAPPPRIVKAEIISDDEDVRTPPKDQLSKQVPANAIEALDAFARDTDVACSLIYENLAQHCAFQIADLLAENHFWRDGRR